MGDLILWFPPPPTTMAIGQGRLIYFCWASLGKHSHIPLTLLSVGRGLPPSLGPAFPRIQSPCGGSPAWGRNALLTRRPPSQAVREQSVSQLRWGVGVGGCWSHSRAPWGLSPRTPTQRPRLGPAERAQPKWVWAERPRLPPGSTAAARGAVRQPCLLLPPCSEDPQLPGSRQVLWSSAALWADRGALCGEVSHSCCLTPRPPLGVMASPSALWPSPLPTPRHWCAWKTQAQYCSEFPDPSHPPLPGVACLGGPPPLTRISPLQFSHPPAPPAKAGENEAVATAETEGQR